MKLGLLNTSILTNAGEYKLKDISLEEAKKIAQDNKQNLDSAVGHESTARIMSTLLGVEVEQNRQLFSQQKGQECLVFKLNGRPEEGKILTESEIKKIGFNFQVLSRIK